MYLLMRNSLSAKRSLYPGGFPTFPHRISRDVPTIFWLTLQWTSGLGIIQGHFSLVLCFYYYFGSTSNYISRKPISLYVMTISLSPRLALSDGRLLLEHPYLPMEAGVVATKDGMYHIVASTYMKGLTGAMVVWWFDLIHTTGQYKHWHPRDHVFSDRKAHATTTVLISVDITSFTNSSLGISLSSRFSSVTQLNILARPGRKTFDVLATPRRYVERQVTGTIRPASSTTWVI